MPVAPCDRMFLALSGVVIEFLCVALEQRDDVYLLSRFHLFLLPISARMCTTPRAGLFPSLEVRGGAVCGAGVRHSHVGDLGVTQHVPLLKGKKEQDRRRRYCSSSDGHDPFAVEDQQRRHPISGSVTISTAKKVLLCGRLWT